MYYAYYLQSMSTLAYVLDVSKLCILRNKCGAYIIFKDGMGAQTYGRKNGQAEGER